MISNILIKTKEVIAKTSQEHQDLKYYQLICELVKTNIKEFSISHCKEKSRQRKDMLKYIQHQLDSINKNVLTLEIKGSLTHNEKERLEYSKLLKSELESKQRNSCSLKAKGACIKARIKWIEEGNIPSRYF